MTEITLTNFQVKVLLLFGIIMNSAEFDVLNFQATLLNKVNKWGNKEFR